MADDEQTEETAAAPNEKPAGEAKPAADAKPAAAAKPARPAERGEKAVVASGGGGRAVAAAGGAGVVVVPAPPQGFQAPQVSRRKVLLIGFWAGMGAMLAGIAATTVNMLYPRDVVGFGGEIFVGTVDQLQPGSFIRNLDAKAWVMRFDADQAEREGAEEGAILALYQRCPHLGCTVPWRPEFSFEDPRQSPPQTYAGWFRCPCHGSTYSTAGVRVFGPAPRSMDTFALTIEDGNITVDTGTITQGAADNPSRATVV